MARCPTIACAAWPIARNRPNTAPAPRCSGMPFALSPGRWLDRNWRTGMADHGQVEYATAEGNDLAVHEATYRNFIQLAYVGSIHVANFVIGLAVGATTGHWMISLA